MSNYYDDFLKHYRIKNIQVNRRYEKIDYYNYTSSSSYYADREEELDIVMDRSAFEQLVKLDGRYEELMDKERTENWIRKQNPSVAEAYDKYKMLLELYR